MHWSRLNRIRSSSLVAATVAIATAVAATSASSAPSPPTRLVAHLSGANQLVVSLRAAPRGTGTFTATLEGTKLVWRLTFRNLGSRAIAAHIHVGRYDEVGAVVIGLCADGERPCVSGVGGVMQGNLTRAAVRVLLSGRSYVDVHTRMRAGGAIRGQLTRRR